MLRAVARNGGVVMIYFPDFFIDPEKDLPWKAVAFAVAHLGWPRTPLSRVVDHIDHVARVAGIDHVGLGSDFANNTLAMPEGLEDVSGFPNLTLELVKRGYTDDAIRKILGEPAPGVRRGRSGGGASRGHSTRTLSIPTRPPGPRASPTHRAA